jgi:2-keto-4-pentenoate hydratase/2-oxohepta-3-ene-1,7-dioic acid hydratase in catechol pathway
MRLIRFGPPGREKPGLWRDGRIVDLRRHLPKMPDIGERFLREGWMERAAAITDPGEVRDARLGCPLAGASKIICLGKNYAAHAREGNFDSPERPLLFAKAPSALNGPFDPIRLPRCSGKVDWEVELALVIGQECKAVTREGAWEVIAGYSVMNDVSGREAQFGDGQWFRGKSFDTFAPLGPALVTADEVADPHGLRLTATVDGVVMQDGHTGDMVVDIPGIIAYISADITLMPGDVIATGTPAGVGIFRDPPVTLRAGNVVECSIEGIGVIRNLVVGP